MITSDELWLDEQVARVRIPIAGYAQRVQVEDALALGNDTGSNVLVLPRPSFADEEAWQTALRYLAAKQLG